MKEGTIFYKFYLANDYSVAARTCVVTEWKDLAEHFQYSETLDSGVHACTYTKKSRLKRVKRSRYGASVMLPENDIREALRLFSEDAARQLEEKKAALQREQDWYAHVTILYQLATAFDTEAAENDVSGCFRNCSVAEDKERS